MWSKSNKWKKTTDNTDNTSCGCDEKKDIEMVEVGDKNIENIEIKVGNQK